MLVRKGLSIRGFTLIEIMIVVVIIGLLAAVAIPAFQQVSRKARAQTLVNNLTKMADAMQFYDWEIGAYNLPDQVLEADEIPAELEPFMPSEFFTDPPIAGSYAVGYIVEDGENRAYAGVILDSPMPDLLSYIDERFDDGSPTDGSVRRLSQRIFIVPN